MLPLKRRWAASGHVNLRVCMGKCKLVLFSLKKCEFLTVISLNKLLRVVHVIKNRLVAMLANEGRYQLNNLKIPHRLAVC